MREHRDMAQRNTFVDASICFAMLFSCSGQIHVVASGYDGDA
jgi:hypothetical protein